MSDDLVKRLRAMLEGNLRPSPLGKKAADRIEELEVKLAKAVEALGILADCVDAGCFCSEMEMATAIDKARTALAELEDKTDE